LSAALPTPPTFEPGAVTRRVLGVPQRGRPRRAGRDRNEREGSEHGEQNEDHDGERAPSTLRTDAPAFLADCAERWKPATRESYAHTVRRWILPAFGNRLVDAIGAKDVRN